LHLNRKTQCVPQQESNTSEIKIKQQNPIICQYCHKEFARKDNLSTHLKKKRCSLALSNDHGKELTLEGKIPKSRINLKKR
jgi:uncharacterized Zn-finger protein